MWVSIEVCLSSKCAERKSVLILALITPHNGHRAREHVWLRNGGRCATLRSAASPTTERAVLRMEHIHCWPFPHPSDVPSPIYTLYHYHFKWITQKKTTICYRRVVMREEDGGKVNVLVTRAGGCMGRHMVECLLEDGGYNVHYTSQRRNKGMTIHQGWYRWLHQDMALAVQEMDAVFHHDKGRNMTHTSVYVHFCACMGFKCIYKWHIREQ